jgi:hypothetical protein
MLIPVEGESGLYRNTDSNHIVNKNLSEYEAYIAQKKARTCDKERINLIEGQLSSLRTDLAEIKTLLLNLTK